MRSLRDRQGEIEIDHSNSPGVPDSVMVPLGYPPGAGRGRYKSATYCCGHCNAAVVIEPKRTRARGHCRKCNQQLCDGCEAIKALTFECRPMAQIIDETLEQAIKQTAPAPSILLGT